ncbi:MULTISPECIES: hypothetical protein [unclassified Amycolatopsis]|uniref:hypothetical protein n=1 Tax=unclassified Amycolatopsis TaxID=2618356 RepID=UPI0034515215
MLDNGMLSSMTRSTDRLSLQDEQQILRQLDRYLPTDMRGTHPGLHVFPQLVGVCANNDPRFDDEQRARGLPASTEVSVEDISAALNLVPQVRRDLDSTEISLIEAALDRGETFESLGTGCGLTRQGMRQRYQRLGGTRRWPNTADED